MVANYTDEDIISELKRFEKEKIQYHRVFPNRYEDIQISFANRKHRLLKDNGKL